MHVQSVQKYCFHCQICKFVGFCCRRRRDWLIKLPNYFQCISCHEWIFNIGPVASQCPKLVPWPRNGPVEVNVENEKFSVVLSRCRWELHNKPAFVDLKKKVQDNMEISLLWFYDFSWELVGLSPDVMATMLGWFRKRLTEWERCAQYKYPNIIDLRQKDGWKTQDSG